jgi:hypothetical protein
MGEQQSIRALTTVLRGSAVPYGYTLTVLATHAVLTNKHGNPDVLEVLLFVVGAVLAFSLLGIAAERIAPEPLETGSRDMIRSGAIHALAVGCAFGAAVLIALVPGDIAWALGSFAATGLYLAVASAEILVARRIDKDLEQR